MQPVYIWGFKLQGLFLRRQKEVARDFSEFLTDRVLTSEKIWNHLLNGPSRETVRHLLREYTHQFAQVAAEERGVLLPEEADAIWRLSDWASDCVLEHLPEHIHVVHGYVDSTLGLQEILQERLEAMDPVTFERVLHPIFEEDELTLILAGAVLGGIAGFLQASAPVKDLSFGSRRLRQLPRKNSLSLPSERE